MWTFKGKYTGEAKAYIKNAEKRQLTIFAWVYSIVILLIFIGMAIGLGDGNTTLILIILGVGFIGIALVNMVLFLYYKREPKCAIEITNDSFNICNENGSSSFVFYKINSIDYREDFIIVKYAINDKVVLQRDLLMEGDWDKLKNLLKKIEESLESDNPIYQIEEPETEFFNATVKEKRIYKRFVSGVSVTTPVGIFQYFATFKLDNEKEVEYEIGQELYEKITEGQIRTLVILNGNFFAFGDGEDS